jgi:hypothetical protein
MECIDLKKIAKKWKCSYSEEVNGKCNGCEWYVEIRGKYGTIYPWSKTKLAVCSEGHGVISQKIKRLNGTTATQGEVTFIFSEDMLPEIASIIRARKKRQLTQDQIEVLTNRLKSLKRHKSQQNQL